MEDGEFENDDNASVCGYDGSEEDVDEDEARDYFDPKSMPRMMKKFLGVQGGCDDDFDGLTSKSTSTHFTDYSISSSVMDRNDKLKSLDEQFEQMFIREYGEDVEIGALDGDDDEQLKGEIDPNQSVLMHELVREYEDARDVGQNVPYEKNEDAVEYVRKYIAKNKQNDKREEEESDDTDSSSQEEIEYVDIIDTGRKGDKDRADCESILSTASNTLYQPTMLRDTDRYGNILLGRHHIRIDPRTGMPKVSNPNELSRTVLTKMDRLNGLEQRTSCSNASRLSELSVRPKGETPEQRAQRKKELKEYRATRRAEKKANRLAFQEEKVKMRKVQLNNNAQKKVAVI